MKIKRIAAALLICFSMLFVAGLTLAAYEVPISMYTDEHWRTIVYGPEAQMVQMMNHDVDVGGPPTPDDIPILRANDWTMASTGGFSLYWYAINNRPQKAPLDDPVFRTALAYCMDKATIYPTLYGPMVTDIYNWAPPAQAFWCNPAVDAAFPRFNLQTAIDTLIGGGYTPILINPGDGAVPGNIENWYLPGTTTVIRDLEQGVPVTSALGMLVSQWLETDINSVGIPVVHTPLPFGYIVYQQWLAPPYLNWDCTIGIGLIFGAEPVLYEMYHVDSIPFANIWGLNDQDVNDYCDAYRETLDWEVAKTAAWACEERLTELMPMVPMITSQTWTCCANEYAGPEPGVLGFVNMKGFGGTRSTNDWCRLFSRREELGDPSGQGEAYDDAFWLMGQDADKLNPLTSDTAYEWALMGSVYSGLYLQNPYSHKYQPWACDDYPTIQLWNGTHRLEDDVWVYDPSPAGSPGEVIGEYMAWTLKAGMTWHDGEPVTAYDVEFCFTLMKEQENERYISVHPLIHDIVVHDDLHFDIYYTGRYLWADVDIAGLALLTPQHIWKGYIDGANNILWDGDDLDHRFWSGYDTVSAYGYTAPSIEPIPGTTVQLTHLQGNGYNVFPKGGWVPDTSMRLVAWKQDSFWEQQIHKGDNDFTGFTDVLDVWPAVYASGSDAGMPKWDYLNAGLRADTANEAGHIDGRDRTAILQTWGMYWNWEPEE